MKPWTTALSMGARLALRRIGGRSALLITLGATVFSTLAAWAERHESVTTAANYALRGPGFGLAIPIATLSLVAVVLSRSRLNDSVGPIATLGGSRRAAVLGALTGTSVVCAMLGLVTATTTALIAHGIINGATLLEAAKAAWIGGLTGGVYAFFYGAASSFGKSGGGRLLVFVADLLFGPMTGVGAVLFPRAHALNLLGAAPILGLPQVASGAILAAMIGVFAGMAMQRTHA